MIVYLDEGPFYSWYVQTISTINISCKCKILLLSICFSDKLPYFLLHLVIQVTQRYFDIVLVCHQYIITLSMTLTFSITLLTSILVVLNLEWTWQFHRFPLELIMDINWQVIRNEANLVWTRLFNLVTCRYYVF